jgi:thiol-disulfide isomerase/thioredoxin
MFNRSNLLIVGVAILGAVLGLLVGTRYNQPREITPPAGVSVLKIGDQRADLHLPDADGKPRHLGEWDGKLVLLNFWATWCGPCREEMPLLDRTEQRLTGDGFAVVGVAIDDADAVQDFLKEHPVRYPILIGGDEEANPSLVFGDIRSVLPYSVLIGPDGTILAQREGSFTATSLTDWLKPHLPPPHSG